MRRDLDAKEERHVRTALRLLRRRVGGWKVLGKALGFQSDTIQKQATALRPISASMAMRVARLVDVTMDELFAGKFAPDGTCPHCGRTPDFTDEETSVG